MARHLLGACLVFSSCLLAARVEAVVPSDQLLPDTTAGYLSVPDIDTLRARWNETELGKMFDDPIMKPFVDDLNEQLEARMAKRGATLGITWEDLEGVYAGEVALALVQPELKPANSGVVLIVDVTGKDAAVDALLAKIRREQTAKGAKVATVKVEGINVTDITLARDVRGIAGQVYYAVSADHLVASDHLPTLTGVLRQIATPARGALIDVPAYKVTQGHVSAAMGEEQSHLRWYVNPFRLVEVRRAMSPIKRKRGTDMLRVLRNQGFTAVQGIGGAVAISTQDHDMLHRTFVYAPQDPMAAPGQKYRLGARMLDFPNVKWDLPPKWVPADSGTFMTVNWRMRDAFGKYLGSVVDEFAGDEIFEEVLESIATDEHGPMVDLRKDLIAHLGERMVVMTDAVEPIDVKSERLMFAFELANPEAVAATINKAMAKEPDVRKLEHNGQIIWEIVSADEVAFKVEEIMIDGVGFEAVGEVPAAIVEEDVPKLPNSALTVAHGHLIVASHVDYLVRALDKPESTLDEAKDYQRVNAALEKLGAGVEAVRQFVRTDKAYNTTYELVRRNKMPEGETLLARALNRILSDEDADDTVVRKQEIDGRKLPEYAAVRHHFGLAGFFITAEKDGWMISGCLLKPYAAQNTPGRKHKTWAGRSCASNVKNGDSPEAGTRVCRHTWRRIPLRFTRPIRNGGFAFLTLHADKNTEERTGTKAVRVPCGVRAATLERKCRENGCGSGRRRKPVLPPGCEPIVNLTRGYNCRSWR